MKMWQKRPRPEKFVCDYKHLKNKSGNKKLEWPPLSCSQIELARERHQLANAEEALQERLERYRKQKEAMNDQWQKLRINEIQFKNQFFEFNSFFITNSEKRKRSKELLKDQGKIRKRKEQKVQEIQDKIKKMLEYKREMDIELSSHNIFANFLNSVVAVSEHYEIKFKNSDDIVARYETYVKLGQDLSENQAAKFDDLQQKKQELDKFIEHSSQTILGLTIQSVNLRGRYEEISRNSHELENLVAKIRERGFSKYTDVVTTKLGIWNLYKLMCVRMQVAPKFNAEDVEAQLVFIKKHLKQLHGLNKALKKLKKTKPI